jgi:hypothetical protein
MNQENTSGFYKNDSGFLSYGQNYVLSGSYNLYREQKNEYSYPYHGWHWFDSEDAAKEYFNLPKPSLPSGPNPYPEII